MSFKFKFKVTLKNRIFYFSFPFVHFPVLKETQFKPWKKKIETTQQGQNYFENFINLNLWSFEKKVAKKIYKDSIGEKKKKSKIG